MFDSDAKISQNDSRLCSIKAEWARRCSPVSFLVEIEGEESKWEQSSPCSSHSLLSQQTHSRPETASWSEPTRGEAWFVAETADKSTWTTVQSSTAQSPQQIARAHVQFAPTAPTASSSFPAPIRDCSSSASPSRDQTCRTPSRSSREIAAARPSSATRDKPAFTHTNGPRTAMPHRTLHQRLESASASARPAKLARRVVLEVAKGISSFMYHQ